MQQAMQRAAVAKEELLNAQERYDLVKEEAAKAAKAKGALERIIAHMEAKAIPLHIRVTELEEQARKSKENQRQMVVQYKAILDDHQAMDTLLQLSRS